MSAEQKPRRVGLAEIRAHSAAVRERIDGVAKYVDSARARRSTSVAEPTSGLFAITTFQEAELDTSLEELSVVEEVLRGQVEELETTRIGLETERLRYADLFESAPYGCLVTDRHGIVREANAVMSRLLNVPSSHLVGRPFIHFVARSDCARYRACLRDVGERELDHDFELRLRPRRGPPVFRALVTARIAPTLVGGGAGIRWIIRRTEPANEPLEPSDSPAMTEREGELAQRLGQLLRVHDEVLQTVADERAARLRAEDVSRSKDDFFAVVSHELRAPLTAIAGWSDLARRRAGEPEFVAHAMEIIQRSAGTQAKLVADMLEASRAMTGKLKLTVEPVPLHALVQSVVDGQRPAAGAKRLRLATFLDAAVVQADRERLQQVVLNLLSNAVKFTPERGAIEVRLERAADHVRLIVKDNGVGIDPETLESMFNPFRQGGQGVRRERGLGLGLFIARSLVEQHGGTVTGVSQGRGKGATFTVVLPVMMGERQGSDRGSAPVLEGQAALAGRSVLVVDDDDDVRGLVAMILENASARVTEASSVAEALELVRSRAPDVIVTDLSMPGADGYELLRGVRLLGVNVPVIVLTAHARDEDLERIRSEGFSLHLAKPITADALVEGVGSVVTAPPKG